ncbi:RAS guanyl-releasing protein 1-like [Orbicella faveolata]|uniref:RAS guanyl-releasing protein 1-like n=1 Tax=Orbicella faveolata TaxID=48498 RepID=UPI0009E1A8F6|nr:RAS guanyl-releasing protein 1-like [Orbicella faveolata]
MVFYVLFSEWKTYVCTGKLGETTYLERYVALFNGLSRWVQAMVLNCVTPQERASCIEKFQQTAKHLKELQNFNGLMAVAGGLTNSVLSRLRQTQELLSEDCREVLILPPRPINRLMHTLTLEKNSVQIWLQLDVFFLVFPKMQCKKHLELFNTNTSTGIQLKDLIALHTALPDTVDGHLLNVQKMIRLSNIMSRLLQVQTSLPALQPNLELIKMLRVSLQPRLTDEELYELSLAREPRMHSHSVRKLVMQYSFHYILKFYDDYFGIYAVFKVYDTNKDGSISTEEFDAIATNFPFIDSFGVLDVNRDGVISREEMKNYFMKAHCHELSKGFSHTFQETTYFTPTFCDHCAGMVRNAFIIKLYRAYSLTCPAAMQIYWNERKSLHVHKKRVEIPQANEAILAENVRLHRDLQDATHKLGLLQNHLNSLRQNTVTFILEQMDALQMQKDTEV